MKQFCFFILLLISVNSYAQNLESAIYEDYKNALKVAADEKKPLFIYIGKSQDQFFDHVNKNDTLTTILENDFLNVLFPKGKLRRELRKTYGKETHILLLDYNEKLIERVQTKSIPIILDFVESMGTETTYFFTNEYKQNFIATDSTQVFEEINNVYNNSSRKNARQLAVAYLQNQKSLLTPTNYQLFKTLLPIGDKDLLERFLLEMEPQMYTREMAEKVAYEIMLVNDFSVSDTKEKMSSFDIPFQKEISVYIDIYESSPFNDKMENCFEFVLEGTTFDFKSLSDCFHYVLQYGSRTQIEQLKQKYMWSINEGPLQRALLYGDLLGQLFLSEGDTNTYKALRIRNERIRERLFVNMEVHP